MRQIGASGKRMQRILNTMDIPHMMHTYALKGLQVCDLEMNSIVDMHNVYTKNEMPVSIEYIPRKMK